MNKTEVIRQRKKFQNKILLRETSKEVLPPGRQVQRKMI